MQISITVLDVADGWITTTNPGFDIVCLDITMSSNMTTEHILTYRSTAHQQHVHESEGYHADSIGCMTRAIACGARLGMTEPMQTIDTGG